MIPAGVELDLGATAKALAADRAARAAAEATADGVLVSLGGDVAVAGDPPRTQAGPVGIADDHAAPFSADGPAVAVQSGGLATRDVRPQLGDSQRTRSSHHRSAHRGAGRHPLANGQRRRRLVRKTRTPRAQPPWCSAQRGHRTGWHSRRLPARLVGNDGCVVCVAGWPGEAA